MIDKLSVNGADFSVKIEPDDTGGPPWENSDGHGVVSKWERGYETPRGSWVLNRDGNSRRFYNWFETMAIAKRDGWGIGTDQIVELAEKLGRHPTPRDIRKEAVRRDFNFLHGWCNDSWYYVGVIVTLEGTDIKESLWGIESCADDYLTEVARELATEILRPINLEKDLAIAETGG